MNDFSLQARIKSRQSLIWLTLLLVSPVSQAEIYKWVDAEGRTHYSERKEDAGKAKAVDLRVSSQPAAESSVGTAPARRQAAPAQSGSRQLSRAASRLLNPEDSKPKSLSGGLSDDSDAARCNLARDVLSGAVRHPNGAPTDAYDRQIAENDVRSFCR